MTNDTSIPSSASDPNSWFAKEQEHARLCESIRPENKAALFDVLDEAGITMVEVTFDGYGDGGQVDSITAKAGDKEAALPAVSIEIARVDWGSPEIERRSLPFAEAIEELAYDFLRETHASWENNEGAFGDFVFDVQERSITLNEKLRSETADYT